jgi:hypothetical protein
MEKIPVKRLDNEYHDWLKALHIYRDELYILSRQLQEMDEDTRDVSAKEEVGNRFEQQLAKLGKLEQSIHIGIIDANSDPESNLDGIAGNSHINRYISLSRDFLISESEVNMLRLDFYRLYSKCTT